MLERFIVGFYLACGALLFFLSTIIWRENPKGRVNRTTAFMLGFAGLGPIFAAVGQTLPPTATAGDEPLYRSLQYFWELFFPFLLLFSLEFPTRHPLLRRHPRMQWLVFVPHVFHIVLVVGMARGEQIASWLQLTGMGGVPGWLMQQLSQGLRFTNVFFDLVFDFHLKFFSVVNLTYVLAALIFLRQSQKLLTNPRLQTQVRVLAWALRVALGMYAVAYIAPILGVVNIAPSLEIALAIAALLIGSGGVAYAIIRYQFLDIRLIARQSIVYTATSAVLVGLYVLVIGQVGAWLREQTAQAAPILDVGFVILAVIFFQPIMSQVEDLIQRFFLRDRTDYRRLMERFSSEIVRIVDFRQLQEKVIATLQEDLLVENAMLAQVVHQPTRIRFYSLARLEEEYTDPEIGELLGALGRVNEPVYFETLSAQAERSRVWAVLAGLKAHILVPLRHGGELAGFLLLSRKLSGYRYTQEDFTVLSVLANQVAIALTNAMLYSESVEKQRMEEELAVARQIQFALLPAKLPESEHFVVDAFAKPARQVGGDFYDFFPTSDGHLGMVIGDASGKGVPAALMIAQLQAVLKTEAKSGGGMARIVRSVNQSIAVGTQNERFATMVYAEFDPERGRLRYCNAGHNYPILIRANGTHETLETGGLLLGVFEDAEYEEGEVVMQPDDVILFYTDGLSEVNDMNGREFGDARLGQTVAMHRLHAPQTICQALLQEVLGHATSTAFEDDATAIVLKKRGPQR
jgi:sigma-B regulation protein RsbU (phosphoserine phosphatase)